ncbi:MAG: hypothetical protein PHG00_08000 [Methylococcales bacterium]|nr:hypothetical protein [Methylococcales bacterium]
MADSGFIPKNPAAIETATISQIHPDSGGDIAIDHTKIDRQGEHNIPHILTTRPFIPVIFEGREDDLQAVHKKLFAGDNLLLLVNGERRHPQNNAGGKVLAALRGRLSTCRLGGLWQARN